MSVQPRRDVAVFIDFENIYVSVRDKLDSNPNFEIIMDHCNQLGRVILARAFADWYRYPRITSALYANNIEPMYVPTYYYDKGAGRTGGPIKNSVDMNLCIDAMRTLFTMPALSTFVLITGDRDFIPLVNSIRQQGKDVIIIGVGGAASSHLAQSADEFLFYEQMVGKAELAAARPEPRKLTEGDTYERPQSRERLTGRQRSDRRDTDRRDEEPRSITAPALTEEGAFALLAKVVLEARARNMVTGIGSLKTLMRELSNGEFRESVVRDASGRPVQTFKDFIAEAARRDKIIISTEGVVNEVFLPGEDTKALSQFAPTDAAAERKEEEAAQTPEDRAAAAYSSANGDKNRRRRRRGGDRTPANGRGDAALTAPTSTDELAIPVAAPVAPVTVAPVRSDVAEVPVATDPAPSEADESDTAAVAIPFSDEERQSVRDIVAGSERPLSFQQIYDMLRGSRNRGGDATIARTNEDLRSLVKLAINTGELQRIGRGNRVTYRIPQPVSEGEAASAATNVSASSESTPTRAEPQMIPTPAEPSEDELTPPIPVAPAAGQTRRRVKQPVTATPAPAPAAPAAAAGELVAPTQQRRRGPKPKTVVAPTELAAPRAATPTETPTASSAPTKRRGETQRTGTAAVPAAAANRSSKAAPAAAKSNTRNRPAAAPSAPAATDAAPAAPQKPRRRTQKPEA